jgi:hypothetical protein
MLKKIAAVLLLIGIATPYSCDVRPVTTLWGDWSGILAAGVPVACIILYALQALAGPLSGLLARARKVLQPLLVVILLVVIGTWITGLLSDENERWPTYAVLAGSCLWGGWLVVRAFGRGRAASAVPLLLLAIVGIPAINYFVWEWGRLKYGAWFLSAGYVLAAVEALRGE